MERDYSLSCLEDDNGTKRSTCRKHPLEKEKGWNKAGDAATSEKREGRIRAWVSLCDGKASRKSRGWRIPEKCGSARLYLRKYIVEKSFGQMLRPTDLYVNLCNYIINSIYIIIKFWIINKESPPVHIIKKYF